MSDDVQATSAPEVVSDVVPDYSKTKHKLKVNGQEREYDYQAVIERAQKTEAADERFRQAAEHRKEADEFKRRLESGDADFLEQKLGSKKFRELAENYLLKQIEFEELPDVEKRTRQLESELAQERKKAKELEDKFTADERQKIESQAFSEIDQEIGEALKATGQKATPRLVARIAETILAGLEKSGNKVDAKTAYSHARKSILDDITEYLPSMGIEELRAILPKDVLEALRKSEVDIIRRADPLRSKQTGDKQTTVRREKPKGMATDDYFKKLEGRFN